MSLDLRELWELVNRTWRKLIGQRAVAAWKENQMKEPLVPIVLNELGRLQAGDVGDFSLTYPALWRVLRPDRWQVQAGPAAVVPESLEGRGYAWHPFTTKYKLWDVDLAGLSSAEIVDAVIVARQLALADLFVHIESFLVATGLDLDLTGIVTLLGQWLHECHSAAEGGSEVVLSSVLAFVPWAPPVDLRAAIEDDLDVDPIGNPDLTAIVEGKG